MTFNTSERLTYTVSETAEMLGISINSAYAAIRKREIHSFRIGNRIIIPKAALEQLLTIEKGGDTCGVA